MNRAQVLVQLLITGWLLGLQFPLIAKTEKSFNLSLPIIAFGGEAVTKVEWNLGGYGGLGLDWVVIGEQELYSDQEIEEHNGDSIISRGQEFSLSYARYGNESLLSGGYWLIGVGYRFMTTEWSRSPSGEFAPTGVALNTEGRFQHALEAEGLTARARIGYRYVAESFPFSIGAYLGVRHYANQFKDRESSASVLTPEEDLRALERRLMSSLEPGVEMGMAF